MKTYLLISLLVGGVVIFVARDILDVNPTSKERDFSAAYKSLEIGMAADKVEKSFGRPAIYRCTFRGSPIHYYKPPPPLSKWFDFRGDIDRTRFTDGEEFTNLNAVPDPYDHVVVVYDLEGALIAYTHIGEEYHIHTKARGPVKGSGLFRLEASDF